MSVTFSPVSEIIAAIKNGQAIILLDDEDRENEGDIVVASDAITPEHISFMLNHARGLICITIQKETAQRLSLLPQAVVNTSPYTTAFLTPVDLVGETLGVTASARAATIRHIANSHSQAKDFVRPGNIFPLLAHEAGVFGRRGQTEGSADLARLAGFSASGVICELLSETGEVLRGKTLADFAQKHRLLCTTIEALKKYRIDNDFSVRQVSHQQVTNAYGEWDATIFRADADGKEHIALTYRSKTKTTKIPLVRMHSECITGDFLGSLRCDCGSQLEDALAQISDNDVGTVLYLRQEGRGIGLIKKLEAYNLQDAGLDTVDANISLGFSADIRSYVVAAQMLKQLGVNKIDIITNNPAKIEALVQQGISVEKRLPSRSVVTQQNKNYIDTKRERMGHLS